MSTSRWISCDREDQSVFDYVIFPRDSCTMFVGNADVLAACENVLFDVLKPWRGYSR
jgi:hypothetical protein